MEFRSLGPDEVEVFQDQHRALTHLKTLSLGAFGELLAVRGEPPGQRAVALAALEGELVVDLVEVTPLDMARAQDRARDAAAVQHDQMVARTRQLVACGLEVALQRGVRALRALADQRRMLVGECARGAEGGGAEAGHPRVAGLLVVEPEALDLVAAPGQRCIHAKQRSRSAAVSADRPTILSVA